MKLMFEGRTLEHTTCWVLKINASDTVVNGALFRTLIMLNCYHTSDITAQFITIVFQSLISAKLMT